MGGGRVLAGPPLLAGFISLNVLEFSHTCKRSLACGIFGYSGERHTIDLLTWFRLNMSRQARKRLLMD